jgi:hypothetical protein
MTTSNGFFESSDWRIDKAFDCVYRSTFIGYEKDFNRAFKETFGSMCSGIRLIA